MFTEIGPFPISSSQCRGADMWDWKHWLPWRMNSGPASKECYPPWHQTFPFPLQLASMELGEQRCRPLFVVGNVPSSSSSLSSWLPHVCEGWVKGCTPADTSCQWEQPCSRKNIFCRWCLPAPSAQDFPPAASWWRCQGPTLQVSWSLHTLTQGPLSRPGFGDWKLSLEIQNSSQRLPLPATLFYLCQLHRIQVLHFQTVAAWENGYNYCILFRYTQLEQPSFQLIYLLKIWGS